MSHVVTIQTQVRDPVAVAAACARLQWPAPTQKTVQLFSASGTSREPSTPASPT